MLTERITPRPDIAKNGAIGGESASGTIFRPGRNAWRVARADRAAVLIDAAAYFGTLRKALLRARHSVYIIGWDVDSRTPLVGPTAEADDGLPRELGPFLTALVERRPELRINILLWDYSLFFTSERETMPTFSLRWKTPPQIDLCLDDAIPLGSSHHQKIVVLDETLVFSGGLDLTIRRWDTCDHDPLSPHRVDPAGKPYRCFHDVQMMIDGDAARAMADLARQRWARAACEELPNVPRADVPWPEEIEPHFRNVEVAIARTEPPYASQAIVQEVETLFHDMIACARRTLYVESQYLTCSSFFRALSKALKRNPQLEAIIVCPFSYRGRVERTVMSSGRARIARILRQDGVADRVLIAAPRINDKGVVADPHVHSKVMIVDDRYLRVGSANLCHRSMGTDTECDLAIAAGSDEQARSKVAMLRETLLAEHCGATLQEVQAAIAQHESIIAAIKSLPKRSHWLQPISDRSLPVSPPTLWETVADPREPIDPTRILSEEGNAIGRSKRRPIVAAVGILLALILFLAVAWVVTPLAELADPDLWTRWIAGQHGPFAAVAVILLFVVLGLVMFPVMVLIAATAAVFGAWPGVLYAAAGALASALTTYAIGRWLGPRGLRQFFGPRLNLITRSFARKGIPTVTLVRLVPVAPFSIVNLAAGAICIPALDYLLGTAIGLMPGLAVMSLLGDQAIELIQRPTLKGVAILASLLVAAVGISIGLQIFVSRRRDRAERRRPGRRLLRESVP
ncbi:VTT domain-containing protein [Dongia deserti]|uniref:VTT domain-containing protein n=1 Tax=Dongia deserti TaxID=2268030 RepID=UPI000E64D0DB|nr:VTT domain-containing protein [Dongia deserti]